MNEKGKKAFQKGLKMEEKYNLKKERRKLMDVVIERMNISFEDFQIIMEHIKIQDKDFVKRLKEKVCNCEDYPIRGKCPDCIIIDKLTGDI